MELQTKIDFARQNVARLQQRLDELRAQGAPIRDLDMTGCKIGGAIAYLDGLLKEQQ